MKQGIYTRLKEYYLQVSAALQGDAKAASIFPNSTDKGFAREAIYSEFLKQHIPSKCNVFYGGFVFGSDGSESNQLDIIINSDTSPRYDFLKKDTAKSFCHVEGAIGVVSIKSKLDKKELYDALSGIASIPKPCEDDITVLPPITLNPNSDWPLKVIYASDSISGETIVGHFEDYYKEHPNLEHWQKPHIIHVAGKLFGIRTTDGVGHYDHELKSSQKPLPGDFNFYIHDADTQALMWVVENIHWRSSISNFLIHNNGNLINKVLKDRL